MFTPSFFIAFFFEKTYISYSLLFSQKTVQTALINSNGQPFPSGTITYGIYFHNIKNDRLVNSNNLKHEPVSNNKEEGNPCKNKN